jgi:Domain of unknown function (DUF4032)
VVEVKQMTHGDITAGEIYKDRQLLERLGYGIYDVNFGPDGGVGFENVKDFTYVVAQDQDPKFYRQKVYDMVGRYYPNNLAKAIWNKFIDHKWVMSERAGYEVPVQTAAQDWMENHSHDFLKEWTFNQADVPTRIRNEREPRRSFVNIIAGALIPRWRELLDAGFTVTDVAKVALEEAALPGKWKKAGLVKVIKPHIKLTPRLPKGAKAAKAKATKPLEPLFFRVKKILPLDFDDGQYFVRMIANLTGQEPETPEEAQRIWHEILEHKWKMGQKSGEEVSINTAALDYFRRMSLLKATESGEETSN